ncbi:---NA--- [Paramuricea clavata]|uniref:---NA n=1 Tax=Paramuricea clavata TaxID=317549 RepID=A0A7D9JPL4_PARCT|nr:---NA--- [Paramuricea clavata]
MDNSEGHTYSAPNKDRDYNHSPDTEIPPEKGIKPMDEQSVEMNNQSEQNLRNGEADFSGKNEGSNSESSSVDSEDDYLDETPTNEVLFQEGAFANTSERRLDDTQVEYIELTEFERRYPGCEASESNAFIADQSSKRRVEQAMENLKLVENFQENGQYDEALDCCDYALQLLDLSQDTNLRMKFCSNIMQLYFLKGNIDAVLNIYYENCVDVLEFVSDPKVIQSIMDMHTLCMKKLKTKDDEE